jgi:hypothetical protein
MKKILVLLFLINAVTAFAQKIKPVQDSDTEKWGFVNARGDWVVEPIFDAVYDEARKYLFNPNFDPSFAVVKYKGKIGCIDQNGKWIIKPVFPANIVDRERAYEAGKRWSKNEPLGKYLYPMEDVETEKWGFVNTIGNWAILPQFDDTYGSDYVFDVNGAHYDFAVVKKGKWGAINKRNEWIVKPIHDRKSDACDAIRSIAKAEDLSVPASQVANYHDKPTNGFQWEGVVEKISPPANNSVADNSDNSGNSDNPLASLQTPTTQTPPAQTTAAAVKPPVLTIVSSPPHYDGDRVIIRYEVKTSDGSPALINVSVDGAPLDAKNLSLRAKSVQRASDEIEIPLPAKSGTRNIALVAVDEKNGLHSATQYISLPFKGEELKPTLQTLMTVGKYVKQIVGNADNPATSTQTPTTQQTPAQQTPAQTTAAAGVKPPVLTIVSSPPHYDGDRVIIRYEAKTSDGLPALISVSVDGAPLDAKKLSLGAKGVQRASDELEIPLPAKAGTRNIALVAVDEKNGLHSATQYISLPFRGEEFKPVLHTLAIGVGKYAKKNITELKYADKDAIDFANTIKGISTNQYREIKDPIVMTNEQADYLSIKKALGNIVKNAKQEDVVILFFSGHGEQDMGNTYYLSHDANTNDLYSSALDFEELNKAVNLLKGDKLCKVLLFMDCCHAGAMSGAKSTFKPIQLVSPNAVKYYSCSAGERSYESTKRPNGIFTAALIDALNGKARDKDQNISTMGLSNYITHTVSAERSDQSPYCDNTQGTFIIF